MSGIGYGDPDELETLAYAIEQDGTGLRVKFGGSPRDSKLVREGFTLFYSRDDAMETANMLDRKFSGLRIVDTWG